MTLIISKQRTWSGRKKEKKKTTIEHQEKPDYFTSLYCCRGVAHFMSPLSFSIWFCARYSVNASSAVARCFFYDFFCIIFLFFHFSLVWRWMVIVVTTILRTARKIPTIHTVAPQLDDNNNNKTESLQQHQKHDHILNIWLCLACHRAIERERREKNKNICFLVIFVKIWQKRPNERADGKKGMVGDCSKKIAVLSRQIQRLLCLLVSSRNTRGIHIYSFPLFIYLQTFANTRGCRHRRCHRWLPNDLAICCEYDPLTEPDWENAKEPTKCCKSNATCDWTLRNGRPRWMAYAYQPNDTSKTTNDENE